MKELFLFIVVLFLTYGCMNSQQATGQNYGGHTSKYPLSISYKNHIPPDSISGFFKTYLRMKGFEIVSVEDMLSMWQRNRRNIFTGSQELNLQSKMKESMHKFGNLLIIDLYALFDTSGIYLIDSLRWRKWDFPVKDTVVPWRYIYIPENLKGNNSLILKSFADSIMSSKVLY